MAAAAGASTKVVMARGGWSSPQMALRYEHATQDRDRFIAQALESLARPAEMAPGVADSTVAAAEDRARSAQGVLWRVRVIAQKEALTWKFSPRKCAPRDSNPKPAD
jgi:hypothetical protein